MRHVHYINKQARSNTSIFTAKSKQYFIFKKSVAGRGIALLVCSDRKLAFKA